LTTAGLRACGTRKRTVPAGRAKSHRKVQSALSATGVFKGAGDVPEDFIQDGIFAPFPSHITHTTSLNQKRRLMKRSKRLGHVLMEVWLGTAKVRKPEYISICPTG
jgi:hypothetical protein